MGCSTCPFCHLTVPSLELERHANNHFEDGEHARDFDLAQESALAFSFSSIPEALNSSPSEIDFQNGPGSSSSSCDGRSSGGGGSRTNEAISFLFNMQIRENLYQVTDGLMNLLKTCLELEVEGSVSILSGYVDHFQSIVSEDVGWGCGWRNIQMLSSHLLSQRQEAKKVLYGGAGFVPDIASLQRWLETAWERGFDALGSRDFDHKIYGKRNWIGTTECAALLRSFGLRARIVDFSSEQINSIDDVRSEITGGRNKAKKNSGPMDRFVIRGDCNITQTDFSGHDNSKSSSSDLARVKGQQVLINWVWNYFSDNRHSKSGNCRVIVTEKAPLYFQHDGHSRTIVGVQVKHQRNGKQQHNLLILDPGHKTEALEKSLKENVGWQKLIKRGVHTLKKLQYQLCHIDPGIAGEEEIEKLKTLDSILVEF